MSDTKTIDPGATAGTCCIVTWYIVQARPYHDWETQCASFDPVVARQQAREVRAQYGTAPVRIVEVELPGKVVWVGDTPSRGEIVRPPRA